MMRSRYPNPPQASEPTRPPPAGATPTRAIAGESSADAASMRRGDDGIWCSTDLLGTRTEIQIDHHGAIYRLRVTALGKLILTK